MNRFAGRAAAALLPLVVMAAGAHAQDGLSVRIDPRVELLATVFRLAGNPEYNQGRVPGYIAAIDTHFAAQREHPVVLEARRLRQQHGVSFDAVMSFAIHIDDAATPALRRALGHPDTSLERRWTAADAERFAGLLAQFVRDSRYAEFLDAQRATLDTARVRMERVVRENIDIDAIQRFFGRTPEGAFIMVPLMVNGDGNFGVRYLDGRREEVYAIIGTSADSTGWPAFSARFVPTMVHEFSHSFVNPAVTPVAERFRASGEAMFRKVETQMRAQAYSNWLTMINESLVRASVTRYVLAHGGEEAARVEVAAQRARGFYWMDELYELFAEYERDRGRYPALDAFLPRIADYFNTVPARLDSIIAQYDRARPSVAATTPADGSDNVDPATARIVIRFDQPMGSRVNINFGPGGAEHYPDVSGVQWSQDGTTLTLQVKLKPAWSYELVLGSGFSARASGIPIRATTLRFKTR